MTPVDTAVRVGYFAYAPGLNPYQRLFRNALVSRGLSVVPIKPATLFPLRRASQRSNSVLHFDWIDDLYTGRNAIAQLVKQFMFLDGLRAIRNTRNVWTIHNITPHEATGDGERQRKLNQHFVDQCTGLLFLSRSSVKMFADRYSIPASALVETAHHGHYADQYQNSVSSIRARGILGVSSDSRVALFFGRVHPYKGVEKLIDAFSKAAGPSDVLIVAGKPMNRSCEESVRSLVAERERLTKGRIVLALTSIDPATVQLYFNASDFTILPFDRILNSGSFMLAKSFGCPVVAPDLGSLREMATAGLDILFTAGTPLAEVLEDALNCFRGDSLVDREPRIQFTREEFSWDVVAAAAHRLYCGCL